MNPNSIKNLDKGGWRTVILDKVDASTTKDTQRRALNVNAPDSMFKHILEAARRRDMSLTAYVRRCVMAVTCRDLGLDWYETMKDEPANRAYGAITTDPLVSKGHGHGPWQIGDMSE